MKKRPRLILWSLLILSVALPFSVPVGAGPSRVNTWRVTARHANGAPKGNAVVYAIVPSCKNTLIYDPLTTLLSVLYGETTKAGFSWSIS
jgi:hypothetical protein